MRVLLVDDDRLLRTTIGKMLEHSQSAVSVDEASDGDEALRRYRECGSYDIVLTDYDHSGLNGYLLAEAIRKENPAQPIACLTGDDEAGKALWENLKIPTLMKPFVRWQLEQLLRLAAAMAIEYTRETSKGGTQ